MTFRLLGGAVANIVNKLEDQMNAPQRITKPGIYTDIPTSIYFADPCPTPSLTQSIAKTLIDRSPWHAWANHPRLNPRYEPDENTKFNIGNAAHRHLIGTGKTLHVVDAPDWRTRSAREERDRAIAVGKTAVLAHQYERAEEMALAAIEQLSAMGLEEDWEPIAGDGEVVIAWQEDGIWFRSMIDWLAKHRRVVWDYKTTAMSAAPFALPNKMASDGWCIQAAMQQRGLDILDPENAGRRKHRFVCQENEYPYALTVAEIPEAAMTMGRKQLEYAIELWRACLERGTHEAAWPGYGREIQYPEYPGFKETAWLDREVAHAERRTREPMLTDLAGG